MESLRYVAGNEYSPTDRWGRIVLDLAGDGAVRLEHITRAGRRVWTANIAEPAARQLAVDLESAGFPAALAQLPPPGDRIRQLHVTGEPEGDLLLPWSLAEAPGYRAVFEALDGIVATIAGVGPTVVSAPMISAVQQADTES